MGDMGAGESTWHSVRFSKQCLKKELDIKQKNNLAQRNNRERRKQKFDFLECEVVRLSTAVAQQERQKVELLAQIQVLQTRHSLEKPSQSRLLPQLQEAQLDFAPAHSWANFDPEGNGAIVLSEVFEMPRRLTREQARQLSLHDVRSIQGEYLLRAGQLLAQNPKDDPQSPACQLLKDVMSERRGLATYISCWLPSFNFRLHDVLAPCFNPHSTPPIDHARLLRVMALSWEQKVALFRECDLYAKKMEAMFQQRSQIVASLKEVPRTVVDQKVLLRDIAAFSSTVAKLVSNSDQAHLNNCYFWGQVLYMPHRLTEHQEARALLECHPHYSPDIYRMREALREELHGAAENCHVPNPVAPVRILEDEPHQDMVEKLVTEFARIDYRSIKGAQLSKALLKRPPPQVQV